MAVTLTTADLRAALTAQKPVAFAAGPGAGAEVIRVSDAERYQRITGFGAAMTDTSAWLIYDELTPAARDELMRELFSQSGIGLTVVRVPMGASDFTATGVPYSYDDLPAGQSDPALADFSVAHDDAYVIPALREMLALNPAVSVLATPWSPPPWMKANDAFDNTGWRGTLLADDYGPLATYFVRFIEAYAGQGIHVAAVTPQNEPDAPAPYPGMSLSLTEEAQWIDQDLAPALAAAGLHPKVYGLDSGFTPTVETLVDGDTAHALNGVAWHCYGGPAEMDAVHAADPALDQIVSECAPGIIPYSASEAAIAGTRNWASSVALWNLALDPLGGPVQPRNYGCTGCTGLATVSEQTHQARLGLDYYQLGQLSKYVRPGAVRIASDRAVTDFRTPTGAYGVTPGLDDVAFENPDGSKVLVAYNNAPAAIRVAIAWRRRYARYTVAPGATVTFTWR